MHLKISLAAGCAFGAILVVGCDEKKPVQSLPQREEVPPTVSVPAQPQPTLVQIAPSPFPESQPAGLAVALPEASAKKLAAPLLKTLQMAQVQLAAGQTVTEMPDIPIHRDGCVLVDLEATVSEELIDHIVSIGGQTLPHPAPGRPVRAFIPLAQLGDLAARADVTAISAAVIVASGGVQPMPSPPAGQ